jgi:ATP-dependent DNA helicase RecG
LVGVQGRPARPVGLTDPEAARDVALQAALRCDPALIIPVPEIITLDGRPVLAITVPPGLPHVYAVEGRYLQRVGRQNRPLSPAQLRRLLFERGAASFEDEPVPGATLDDIHWEKAERYVASLPLGVREAEEPGIREAGEDSSLHPHASAPGLKLLQQRGCITADRRPTHAGILLFGRESWRFVRGSEVICVRYAGTEMGDEYVREDVRDNLPDQIRRAEAFVVGQMRVGARLTGLARDERLEYPREAVREAIVNAVAHRDYSLRGQEIRVFMFADRIEVYSPGRLPGPVTLDNLVEERFSRNEIIVQVLADLGFIERLGYGIDRMIRAMDEEGLPPPVFKETAAGFQVTLYGHGPGFLPGPPGPRRWAGLRLNPRQEQALEFLAQRDRITSHDFQTLCPDVSPETLRRDLADLVEQGALLRVGDKRGTYYILK